MSHDFETSLNCPTVVEGTIWVKDGWPHRWNGTYWVPAPFPHSDTNDLLVDIAKKLETIITLLNKSNL